MPRKANDSDVECEVETAKLGADSGLAGFFEDAFFEFNVAKGAAVFVAGGWEGRRGIWLRLV